MIRNSWKLFCEERDRLVGFQWFFMYISWLSFLQEHMVWRPSIRVSSFNDSWVGLFLSRLPDNIPVAKSTRTQRLGSRLDHLGKTEECFHVFLLNVHHLPNFTIWRVLKIIPQKNRKDSLSLDLPQLSLKLLRYLHGIPQGKDTVS